MSIRVFLLDDHEVVRTGIRYLLEDSGITVVSEAENLAQARSQIDDMDIDIAIVDLRLPDGSGIELCKEILAASSTIKCLILTSFQDEVAYRQAKELGISGYILKDIRGTKLVETLQRIHSGEQVFEIYEPDVSKEHSKIHETIALLTDQEFEILKRIGQGKTNQEIAEELFLAEKTVRNYVSQIFVKLGVRHRTEAALLITQVF